MPLIHASDRPRPGRPLQGQHRLQRVQRRLAVGRIYERRGFSPDIRWEWSVHGIVLRRSPRIRSNGSSASLEEAKCEFQKCWDAWKAWAKLEEVP